MFNQKTLVTTALIWIPLAIVFTMAVGFSYVGSQQVYRMSLNDPQVQITGEAVEMVKKGQDITALVPTEQVDMAASLSPFIIFYDANGKMVAGSGTLDGTVPTPPASVFTYTARHGEDRFTWQPQKDVRVAAVVRKTSSGYVLAARSMKEIENRIMDLTYIAAMAWVLGLALSLTATLVIAQLRYRKNS